MFLLFFISQVSPLRVHLRLKLTAKTMAMGQLTSRTGQQHRVNMLFTFYAMKKTYLSLHTWPKLSQ